MGDANVGKFYKVGVSYIDKFGTSESLQSVATTAVESVNDRPTGLPVIKNAITENSTLEAVTTAIKDNDGLGSYSYEWQVATTGAANASWTGVGTAQTYTVATNLANQFLRLKVQYTDQQGTTETLYTAAKKIATQNLTRTGSVSDDSLAGMSGKDILSGLAGDDILSGGAGDDTLIGGADIDVLIGGLGKDIFRYLSSSDAPTSGLEIISDFVSGVDKIDLKAIDAKSTTSANDTFTFLSSAPSEGNAHGVVWFEVQDGNGILYGSTNTDTSPEFQIQLTGVSSILVGDLVL